MNLHIFLSTIESETRLFKETQFTLEQKIFPSVAVCGLWGRGTNTYEKFEWGLEVYRKRTFLTAFSGGDLSSMPRLFRVIIATLSLLQFAIFIIRTAISLRPTHVTCHNCLLLPLSWLLAKFLGTRLVYAPHELETERTHLHGLQKKLEQLFERVLVRSCDRLVVVCEPISDWYKERYQIDNISVIRNLPKAKDTYVCNKPRFDFREIFKIPSESMIFIYQGILGSARGTPTLLNIFSGEKLKEAHLVLMGFGDDSCIEEIKDFQRMYSNIHYHPAVPMEEIISHTSSADVGIFVSDATSLSYQYALPNKFFEYLHGGLPVIVSDNLSYLSSLVKTNSLGWVANIDELERVILDIHKESVEAARFSVKEYSSKALWENDAEQYHSVYSHPAE